MTECFALLDDFAACVDDPRSRLYTGFIATITCQQASTLPDMLAQMQQALAQGQHAVGLFSYELGADLVGVGDAAGDDPLAQVLLFERCERLSADAVARWLENRSVGEGHNVPSGIANVRANVTEPEFAAAIDTIHAYIEAGDTYQVNYTYRLRFDAYGSPVALYRRLRERQPVPYGALIGLPDGRAVLSLSPELFLRHENGALTARPMKGTAPASGDPEIDTARAQTLAADEKNRAENLMIVDLLRNDLGRIAEFGSVRVPALHEVTRYGSVLQMTSTITARLREDVSLAEVFGAIYPCGSITGAPKKRTMEIIHEVEPQVRGLYTGAIGWFDATGGSDGAGENNFPVPFPDVPDFCLSVPIRTLVLQAPSDPRGAQMPGILRRGELGVGAGIVYDSIAAEEYAECQLKARFLTGLPQQFALFETLRATTAGCALLARHLQRLQASSAYLGFPFDAFAIHDAIQQACAALPHGDHRMRLALGADGVSIQTTPLQPIAEPVRVLLATRATRSEDLFLRHKTTVRDVYDAAWRDAEREGAFDTLFFNEHGELTEGGRSNVFVKLNGSWFTPPLSSGVLPGVMRAVLLDDPAWGASERRLTVDDLRAAEAVVVCNALRGVLTVHAQNDY